MKKIKGCIYKLTNLVNGDLYFGQHGNVETVERIRWYTHFRLAELGVGTYVHNAIADYSFQFSAEIVWIGAVEKLNEKEIYYIKKFHTFVGDPKYKGGYNLTKGGDGVRGFKHKAISIKRMSKKRKALWDDEIYAMRMSEAHKGYVVLAEVRAAISKKLTGHVVLPATRQAQSDGNKRALIANPIRLGKIKAGLHCKPHTDAAKEKMRQAALGKTVSATTRAKIAATLAGRIINVETRQRMSEGVVRWWAARKAA